MKTTPLIEPFEPRPRPALAPASITVNTATKRAMWTDRGSDLVTFKYSSAVVPADAKIDEALG